MSRTTKLRRVVLAAAATLLASAGGWSAASAYNTPGSWNTTSSPLYETHYGSKAWAAGTAYMANGSSGTKLYNTGVHKFTDADNHRPYLKANSEWNAGSCSSMSVTVSYKGREVGGSSECARVFYDGQNFARADGVTYTTTSWRSFPTMTATPNAGSDRGRSAVQLCIDVPWRTDACTGVSYSPSDSF